MIGALALAASAYIGYAGLPWWIATIFGAIAGFITAFVAAKRMGVDFDDPNHIHDPAMKRATSATLTIVALNAVFSTGVCLLAAWLTSL